MCFLTGIAHSDEDAGRRRIVPCARDRAEHPIRQRPCFGGGVVANRCEILALPVAFPRNPPRPLILEGPTEYAPELRSEVALASLAAIEPCKHALVAVAERQVAYEARAVQVGVGAHLKVDRGAFR